jgi:hypothetical protein
LTGAADVDDAVWSRLSGDTTNSQGKIFEGEALKYLDKSFSAICGDLQFEPFRTRDTDDYAEADLDVFSYAADDDGAAFQAQPKMGFYIPMMHKRVEPASPTSSAMDKDAKDVSPNWTKEYQKTTRLTSNPSKYIVGEAYSGRKDSELPRKLEQLESRLRNLRNRFIHRHQLADEASVDVTMAVAGAALVLAQICASAEDTRVREVAEMLRDEKAPHPYPFLYRMALAGRFVVVVVPYSECPVTTLAAGQNAGFKMMNSKLDRLLGRSSSPSSRSPLSR